MAGCATRLPIPSAGLPTPSNVRSFRPAQKVERCWRLRSLLRVRRPALLLLFILAAAFCSTGAAADKKIVFIAGTPSHAAGEHEYRAGCLLLKRCIDRLPGII